MAFAPVVLVIEDEAALREVLAEGLNDYGFEVLTAADGSEAIELALRHPIIDVIVTDIRLPGRIDGIEVARRLRADRPELTVVYASGYSPHPGDQQMVPAARFIPKPFTAERIVKEVEDLLTERLKSAPSRPEGPDEDQ